MLLRAIEQLGIDHLIDPGLAETDPKRLLQITSAAAGVADGQSIAYAAQVMKTSDVAALEAADDIGYRATRMLARDERTGELLWCLWTLRRLTHRLNRVRQRGPHDDVDGAAAALHVVHALLSAAVYDGPEAETVRAAMRKEATSSINEIEKHLP
ncbi:hypothetical protein [Pseudonocardia acidicola]|uniref:Uncharacterized protein n=1 Tax=Pseudonocardia acidicola TaxID=2724939 RepID=A0ABX1S4U3_9PSEU|nr:hypothetical protein [Pseudonocardia acidicola]NMH96621.1 hypothetical protein [Pseudonocardia acidicola]